MGEEQEFDWYEWEPKTTAEKIVYAVHNDMRDRGGVQNAIEGIDDDILEEMIQTHVSIVEKEMKTKPTDGGGE